MNAKTKKQITAITFSILSSSKFLSVSSLFKLLHKDVVQNFHEKGFMKQEYVFEILQQRLSELN